LYAIPRNAYPDEIDTGDLNHGDIRDIVISMPGHDIIIPYLIFCCEPLTNASHLPNQLDTTANFITTGNFNRSYPIGASTRPRSPLVVDLNNDTHLDTIVSGDGTNSVGILLGNGDGSFRQDWHLYTDYATNPSSMVMVCWICW
jgi:hypothetical protein